VPVNGFLRDPRQLFSTALQQFAPAIPDQGSPTGLLDTDHKEIGVQALFLSRPRHGLEEALALAREYPPAQMRIVQEGSFKEDRVAA
jgi:hypothetical protein